MKPSALATVDKKELVRFNQIHAQFTAINNQRMQLHNLEVSLIVLKSNLWLEIIKKYYLPTFEEIQSNNFDLQINFETGEIYTCPKVNPAD